jgi:hypothetical protein
VKALGQFIDWLVPIFAFLLFAAAEGVVIYWFLRMTGIIV